MSRAFDYCVKRVMSPEVEGGEVNDPRDPGGHTNLGVTAETLRRARLLIRGLPESVSELTREQAAAIYAELYWHPIRGDDLPLGVSLLLFDAAVNQGPHAAILFLQRALGVKPDGVFGPATLRAAQLAKLGVLLPELASRRMHHYMTLDTLDDTFGLGWSRRLIRMYTAAMLAPIEA
jgi:lysozyme family protein